jgi:dihydrofolate reductase
MSTEREELFSEKVIAGRRTYYFDVKEDSHDALFLVISETRPAGDGSQERTRVVVYEEYASAFNKAMKDALRFMMLGEEGRERKQ